MFKKQKFNGQGYKKDKTNFANTVVNQGKKVPLYRGGRRLS